MFTAKLYKLAIPLFFAGIGCSVTPTDKVNIDAVMSDLTVKPLEDAVGREVRPVEIMGTYAGTCKLHPGEAWALKLNGEDRGVEVALNERIEMCPLTLSSIKVHALGPGPDSFFDVFVTPEIQLDLEYASAPSAMRLANTDLAFYGNAVLQGLATPKYTNDFNIHFIYSDDAKICGKKAPPAVYAKIHGTANGDAVPPPDYKLRFDDLQLVVDAERVVLDLSTGALVLKDHKVAGEFWRVFDETEQCCGNFSFAEIDHLYNSGMELFGAAIEAGDVVIPWTQLGLLGERLPESRVIIVKHTGDGSVWSYELFQVLFPGPHKPIAD
jgi:hypothetical protein